MKNLITNYYGTIRSRTGTGVVSFALLTFIGLVLAVPTAQAADPPYTFKAITYIGSPAPGGGAFTNDFEPSLLNNAGVVAFTSEPDQPGEEATFLAYPNGTIIQMTRFGLPAPGGGTISTFELGSIGLNNIGDAAFAFTLEPLNFGPPVNGGVYRWSHQTHSLSAVLVPNVTPDPAGGVFAGAWFNAGLNDFGQLLFSGYVTNGTVGLTPPPTGGSSFNGFYGSFVQTPNGQIHTVARPGQASPDGGTFLEAGGSQIINEWGDVLFEAQTTLDPTTDYFKLYVRHSFSGKTQLLPSPSGMVYAASVALNNFGQVAYGAAFVPFSVAQGEGGVYLFSEGTTKLIAKTGDPAPGGGTFSVITGVSIQENMSMNDWGDIVFEAATSAGDEAMYLYSGITKKLRRLAGIGTVIPGVGTIASLEQGGFLIYPPPPTLGFPLCGANINDRRQVSFAATVVNGTTTRGVLLIGTPQW